MNMQKLNFQKRFILKIILVLTVAIGISPKVNSQNLKKGVITWYVYEEGKSSFKDLEPFKDILLSISVFGNPPKSFIDECHKNNIGVFRGVGGNEQSINTPEKQKKLIESYVNDCLKNGYDGIDLDFEHLDSGIEAVYSDFLKETSAKLHGINKKLSHCVGFYPNLYQDETPKIFCNPKVVASTCDLIRVMCYDMYYAPGKSDKLLLNRSDCQGIGATSTYPFVNDAMKFWLKYVSKDKLVMGMPAYSNDYEITIDGKGKQTYASVPENIKGILPVPIWLWYEKINLYQYNDIDNRIHLFYASDEKSTATLLELADDLKISNVGFWHFGSVDSKTWNVVRKWIK